MSKFDRDGYGFLLRFVRKQKGRSFSAESATMAAIAAGIAPANLKHWGKIYTRMARDGYIARSDVPYRRVMGNGTITLGWVAT